jgi:hypothetical protein
VAFVRERLKAGAGGAFFSRSAGLMEDWDGALREVEDIYRRPSRPKADSAPPEFPQDDPPT